MMETEEIAAGIAAGPESEPPCFWADEQATARLPVGDRRQAGPPRPAWRQRADWEAGPQRPVSVQVGPPVSRPAVATAAVTTGQSAVTAF